METSHRRIHGGRVAVVRAIALLCVVLLTATACEKIDIGEEELQGGSEAPVRPTSLGEGTQLSPYTVEQVMAGDIADAGYHWFIGYLVGSTYRTMSNASFSAETTYTSNILLSSDSTCNSTEKCIPVELLQASLQQDFSLAYNKGRHRRCLVLNASFGRYFSRNGLRNVKTAYWLSDFDLSAIDSTPEEWDERTVEY